MQALSTRLDSLSLGSGGNPSLPPAAESLPIPNQADNLIWFHDPESIPQFLQNIQTKEECLLSLQESKDETVCAIATALLPFACTQTRYAEVLAMKPYDYATQQPPELFTYAHLRSIALIVSKVLSEYGSSGLGLFVRRKELQIPIKPSVHPKTRSFCLLPKKNAAMDLSTSYKCGRQALFCREVDGIWRVERAWNLSSKKTKNGMHSDMFYKARVVEERLRCVIPAQIFAKVFWDVTQFSPAISHLDKKRSCYYPLYKTLVLCLHRSDFAFDRKRLQQVALRAAEKVGLLHEHGFVWHDVKPDNMLLADNDEVFLCDPDLVNDGSLESIKGGTVEFLPPEKLLRMRTDGKKRDVFAFACMLHLMIFGCEPRWFDKSVGNRKLDLPTLRLYETFAEEAEYKLEAGLATSIQKAMVWLTQRAMHPGFFKRPDMCTIIRYLSSEYKAEDDLADTEISQFLGLERKEHGDKRAQVHEDGDVFSEKTHRIRYIKSAE